MTCTSTAQTRGTLSVRAGVSPKLLARKSAEKLTPGDAPGGVESSFPAHADHPEEATPLPGVTSIGELAQEPATAGPAPGTGITPAPALPWSDEDESGFQALSARRKASGKRRAANSAAQRLQVGGTKPNPDTVVAVIVGIVAGRGSLSRGELLTAMTSATFPHAKARPSDESWCQGYVAGALRNGFLAAAEGSAAAPSEYSANLGSECSTLLPCERAAACDPSANAQEA